MVGADTGHQAPELALSQGAETHRRYDAFVREAEFWRDAAMPFIESRRSCRTTSCYQMHSHHELSIGVVDDGWSVFTGAADGPIKLHPGTVVVIPPQRAHACNPVEGQWSYQMMHLDPVWVAESLPELWTETMADVRLYNSAEIYHQVCQVNDALFSPISWQEKEELLLICLAEVLLTTAQQIPETQPRADLNRRMERIIDSLHSSGLHMSLTDLSRASGLSRYQLIRAFRDTTGFTPIAWQLNERVNSARERLKSGTQPNLAMLAVELGFSDQSHFQRVFKAHTGVTPGTYRESAL